MARLDLTALRARLNDRRALLAAGATPREIDGRLATGEIRRIRRDAYVDGDVWRSLRPEERHAMLALAVAGDAVSPPVFSHVSAAVLHGLPLYRVEPPRVHVLVGEADRSSRRDVFRHEGELPAGDVVELDGLRLTSLSRTVFDLARVAAPEISLSCADAALGLVGGDPRRFDVDAAESWRDGMLRRCGVPGLRGVRRARLVAEIADGRAELPLESITRLQLLRLGFRDIRLQVPIARQDGGSFWMDIAVDDAFIECDGRQKYVDAGMRGGRSIDDVVLAEKRREDWVRGSTGRRILRVAWPDVASADALRRHLLAFHLPVPRRPHLLLPTTPLMSGM